MNFLKPDLRVSSLSSIKLESFWQMGKRGIILDLDNTITPWNEMEITADAQSFLQNAFNLNFKLFLLTNAKPKRTKEIAHKYAIDYLAPALKPRKRAFLKALSVIDLEANQVLVVGDQIFTDILGGNRVGCFTILVTPVSKQEFVGTKLVRVLEAMVNRWTG